MQLLCSSAVFQSIIWIIRSSWSHSKLPSLVKGKNCKVAQNDSPLQLRFLSKPIAYAMMKFRRKVYQKLNSFSCSHKPVPIPPFHLLFLSVQLLQSGTWESCLDPLIPLTTSTTTTMSRLSVLAVCLQQYLSSFFHAPPSHSPPAPALF